MKILKANYPQIHDHVPTEDVIINGLLENKDAIPNEYTLVVCNWAKCINALGLELTQKKLFEVQNTILSSGLALNKTIFVCQHILGESLEWNSSLVFSPHATEGNKFIPIPHLAVNCVKSSRNKDLLASFMGSFSTHWTRKVLNSLNSSRFKVVDSGKWYYENPDFNRGEKYRDLMAVSKFSLCPRGTGPSTIRIWESLASGSIPVIYSDQLIMPDIPGFNWNDIAVFIPEWLTLGSLEILDGYSFEKINKMSKQGKLAYSKYCTDKNMWKLILHYLIKE